MNNNVSSMNGLNGKSLLTHLECSACSTLHDHTKIQTVCTKCGKTLLARYDLATARKQIGHETLRSRPRSMWRYHELLPVIDQQHIISLGEGWTPMTRLEKLGDLLGIRALYLKDESSNATGSFKARGLSMAVSKARELGVTEACMPTAGNAGGALAAYGAAARITSHIYMPEDTPRINIDECRIYGADVHLVKGLISDAGKAMAAEKGGQGWFDMSTLKEPYRLEGKKTMGYEIAEQFGWQLPDMIVYPTGGGTGLIGMWKAFEELEALGWIDSRRPKMVSVQSSGCAPIVRAFEQGAKEAAFWEGASTIASGLRVPKAFADTLILEALYASNGRAVAVPDQQILHAIMQAATLEGIMLCPEGAATLAALTQLRKDQEIGDTLSIVLFNTGSGYKYGEALSLVARM